MKKKCDDCASDIFQISLKKLLVIAFTTIPVIITSTYAVSSIIHEQQGYNSDTDSLKVSVRRIENKVDLLYYEIAPHKDLMTELRNIEQAVTVAKIDSKNIIKYPPQKRISNSVTAFDNEDFESKILE